MNLRTRIDRVWMAARGAALLAAERLETGIGFNPIDPELRRDPYPFYARLRTVDPFHRCRNADGWVLSRYEDVLAVLRDPAFSADERTQRRFPRMRAQLLRAGLPDPYADRRGSMLRLDPPDHTRLRGLVAKAFTPRAVERMRPRIEAILKELVEARPARGPMELVTELAAPLPVRVIAEMLGIPPEDHEQFRRWSNAAIGAIGDGGDRGTTRGAARDGRAAGILRRDRRRASRRSARRPDQRAGCGRGGGRQAAPQRAVLDAHAAADRGQRDDH